MPENAQHFVRYEYGHRTSYGHLKGDVVYELEGSIFDSFRETGDSYPLREVKLLYPCEPRKILAVARNYASHLGDRAKPEKPELFWKPVSALQHPEKPIVIPRGTDNCHFEGELVIIIGKEGKQIPASKAMEHVFGVTCGNDVSARDWQKGDLQWWRAKGCDTFAPLGPSIATGLNPNNLLLTTRVNGETAQQQRTDTLYFPIEEIVEFASRSVTLLPGDVIYTGTPGNTFALSDGDTVEIEIEGVGTLRNSVIQKPNG